MSDQAELAILLAAFPGLRLLTLTEAAKLTRIPLEELRELCRRGEIAARRAGEDWRIPPAAIGAYYDRLIGARHESAGQPAPRSIGRPRRAI